MKQIKTANLASAKKEASADHMKRRAFFGKAGIGSAAMAVAGMGTSARAQNAPEHEHDPVSGPLASATISFGAWRTTPPLDRFPNVSDTRNRNQHQLIPAEVRIRAGGSVNFIIAGFHQVVIYGDGTQPSDVNHNLTSPVTMPNPNEPPVINDPTNRIYRGVDPSIYRAIGGILDRVEVVHFHDPGTYLVICGLRPHFLDGMFGYIEVLPCHCQ